MKRIHLLRVESGATALAALFAAARERGARLGWLELRRPGAADPGLEEAAAQGALRAVAAGSGRVVAVKPLRAEPVLGDLLREHFRGCLAVLVAGEIEAPVLKPREGGWEVVTGAGTRRFTSETLLAALRRPRPFAAASE